jgi:protein TonB
MAAGYFGWEAAQVTPTINLPQEHFLELVLDVNEPVVEMAESEIAPEAAVSTGPPGTPAPNESLAAAEDTIFPPLPPEANIIQSSPNGEAVPEANQTINLEATAPKFKSYNTSVRTAVARHWILPPAARSDFKPGRFVAVMTLDRQGQVVVIVVEESSGSSALDFAAMEALRGAAPYPEFPPELAQYEQLNFRLHFDYRAVHRRPGLPPTPIN